MSTSFRAACRGRSRGSATSGREALEHVPTVHAPRSHLVFKRWDLLGEADAPDVVVFFVGPDELAGLFMLAHFDEVIPDPVLAPFASGCMALGSYPLAQREARPQRAILGMLDPGARSCLPDTMLTLAIPMAKLERMIASMEESFLTTPGWGRILARIAAQGCDDADCEDCGSKSRDEGQPVP
jgi:hypothetical protein